MTIDIYMELEISEISSNEIDINFEINDHDKNEEQKIKNDQDSNQYAEAVKRFFQEAVQQEKNEPETIQKEEEEVNEPQEIQEKVTDIRQPLRAEEVTEQPLEEVVELPHAEEVTESPREDVTESPREDVTESPREEVTEPPHVEEVIEPPHVEEVTEPPHVEEVTEPPHVEEVVAEQSREEVTVSPREQGQEMDQEVFDSLEPMKVEDIQEVEKESLTSPELLAKASAEEAKEAVLVTRQLVAEAEGHAKLAKEVAVKTLLLFEKNEENEINEQSKKEENSTLEKKDINTSPETKIENEPVQVKPSNKDLVKVISEKVPEEEIIKKITPPPNSYLHFKEQKDQKNKFNNFKRKMLRNVKPIESIMDESKWNVQSEKTATLQHQTDSHRAYLFDHKLVKFNKLGQRVESTISKIPGINYFRFLKGNTDLSVLTEEKCNCDTYEKIQDCEYCNQLQNTLASRSIGKKYDLFNLPKWNTTFCAGALRSENRVFHGTYKVRMKTRLRANCVSYITFSMNLPVKDPLYPNNGFWEEVALGFNSEKKNELTLFIKSDISVNDQKKHQVTIPITIKDKKFNRSEYNNYTLYWEEDQIKLNVNGKTVYKSLHSHPIPQLPGYSYIIIRPSYNTHNYTLIKNIKNSNAPNINIKSFKYIPLIEE